MQFMFTNRPLEKVPCQLAEEFKVRLKTALTQRPNFNIMKMASHVAATPSTRPCEHLAAVSCSRGGFVT